MRSRCSLYVDVGYLLTAAATRVTGTSLRNSVNVEYRALVDRLIEQAGDTSGLPVLRLHWYDSARDGVPDAVQARVGELPKVKLRLGRFGYDGQQKGVDLRIGLDLVTHARNRTADVFFLVSGDDDLTEAVEEAQGHGVEVIVLAVPTNAGAPHGLSKHLTRAADEVVILPGEVIDDHVRRVELPPAEPVEAVEAEASPAPAAPSRPPVPTPAVMAREPHHAAPTAAHAAARPRPSASSPPPEPRVAYSGSTGRPSIVTPGYDVEQDEPQILAVVDRVLAAYLDADPAQGPLLLQQSRPSIPREIDRALLQDLSEALDEYDVPDQLRFRLRSAFWERYDATR